MGLSRGVEVSQGCTDPEASDGALPPRAEARLRQVLVARYGWEDGVEAWREAVAYAWQHRERLAKMANPIGYLYRVGQSAARRERRWHRVVGLPVPEPIELHSVEPGLPKAIASLSGRQRVAVLLVHGHGWTHEEAAAVLGISTSTLRNHLDRGLTRLRAQLGIDDA
jgi:RNA polymerase sigma-70 factor (ECF subfamily)